MVDLFSRNIEQIAFDYIRCYSKAITDNSRYFDNLEKWQILIDIKSRSINMCVESLYFRY